MEESEARFEEIEMPKRKETENRGLIEDEELVDVGINEGLSAKIKMDERQAMEMEKRLWSGNTSPVDAGIDEDLSCMITMQEMTSPELVDTSSKDDAHLDAGISKDPSPKSEMEERNAEIEKEAENEVRVDAGIEVSLKNLDLRPGRFSAFTWRLRRLWSGPPVSAPSLPLKEGK